MKYIAGHPAVCCATRNPSSVQPVPKPGIHATAIDIRDFGGFIWFFRRFNLQNEGRRWQ
jgi:hypothetical protein